MEQRISKEERPKGRKLYGYPEDVKEIKIHNIEYGNENLNKFYINWILSKVDKYFCNSR